jgi:hypothetical protein
MKILRLASIRTRRRVVVIADNTRYHNARMLQEVVTTVETQFGYWANGNKPCVVYAQILKTLCLGVRKEDISKESSCRSATPRSIKKHCYMDEFGPAELLQICSLG